MFDGGIFGAPGLLFDRFGLLEVICYDDDDLLPVLGYNFADVGHVAEITDVREVSAVVWHGVGFIPLVDVHGGIKLDVSCDERVEDVFGLPALVCSERGGDGRRIHSRRRLLMRVDALVLGPSAMTWEKEGSVLQELWRKREYPDAIIQA